MEQAIICVDDEKSILWGLQFQITREFESNYLIEFAESAEEALEIVEELNTKNISTLLVITDQIMPGMKGNELINKLAEITPSAKCILLTGYAASEVYKDLNAPNLVAIMAKPWNQEELITVIAESLNYSIQ